MKRIDPRDITIIKGLPPVTSHDDRIAMDGEFFGMKKKKMHRPHGTFASLACTMDSKTVYIVTDTEEIPAFFERVQEGVHLWANGKFDATQLRPYAPYPERDRIWDIQYIEQILFSGYYNEFSQKDLARRWLDVYLEKDTREEFATATVMTPEMIEYAAIDVVSLWRIYQAQRAYIQKCDLSVWTKQDRPALWTVLEMDGMILDGEAWTALAMERKAQADVIKAKYPSINLNSPTYQVLPYLQSQDKKYKKLKSTGKKVLEKIVGECEFARDLMAFRSDNKAASTYGLAWLKDIEADGRIYSDFKITGASTGRFSSSSPNLENIPKDNRYRACFVAAPGHVLVDADWSSQEPRCAAYLSKDKKLIAIFQQRKDIYIEAARLMFGWELTKKDPRRNNRMKPTVLGACYGLTEHGMEEQYGVPQEEGKELLAKFFEVFSDLKKWIDEQQSGHDYVSTIYGRKFWLNPYQDKSDRNAINSPVQGSAGDGLKMAAYQFLHRVKEYDSLGLYYIRIVNLIHDEILVECDEAVKDDVKQMLHDIMIGVAEEMHPGIPADVEIGCGHTWAEAHG